jgi:D-alanyl-D-alanine carboxypeptidase (penicillin-binding protein 5/6)
MLEDIFVTRKINKILSLFILIIMVTNTFAFGEINVAQNIKGALLGDLETGEILYEYNINEQLAIASISKLMTYTVMMDAVKDGKITLDDNVVISGHTAATEGSEFGLLSGETVKLSMLVKGMLVVSGNDCATAIAEYVGKTEDNFVKMMNEKASEIGLLSASFINPHGLPINDSDTGQNHMSVSDIYKLVRNVLTNYPEILEVTKLKELVVPERNFSRKATNPVLEVIEGVDGLKTGFTDEAGLCLVSTMPITENEQDYRLICIVMGSQTEEGRVKKTKELLEYGKNNFKCHKLLSKEEIIDKVNISNSKDEIVDVYPAEDYSRLIKNDEKITTNISYNNTVKAPIAQGDKIGTVSILLNDEEIGQVDAVVNKKIEKANIFVKVFRFFGNLFV